VSRLDGAHEEAIPAARKLVAVDALVGFRDRAQAGALLAAEVARRLSDTPAAEMVVLGLPRGGVPVAAAVADALGVPLDVLIVRKLGVPYQPELAMGAIGEDGARVLNEEVLAVAGVTPAEVDRVERRERDELERRVQLYRAGRARHDLAGRTAIIVDDGIATGSTVAAACQIARQAGAGRVIVATPVAPPSTMRRLTDAADDVIAVLQPESFFAIGEWYADFSPTSDAEVRRLLQRT
jgi:putative phosphoribosyl transferase